MKIRYMRSSRAVQIFESAMALEILNAVLNKTGGDNKKEIIKNFENIPNLNIDEFDLDIKFGNLDMNRNNVFLVGFMGSGKTAVYKGIHPLVKAKILI